MAAGALACRCKEQHRGVGKVPFKCKVNMQDRKAAGSVSLRWSVFRSFVNLVIACLNWMYGVKSSTTYPVRHTDSQTVAVTSLVARAKSMLDRLQALDEGSWKKFVPEYVLAANPLGPRFRDLEADKVDNLQQAGCCDPTSHLPLDTQAIISDAAQMFAHAPAALENFAAFSAGRREEYVKLIMKQLRSGKLGLSSSCKGGGTSMAVGKPGGDRLREVWHGQRVSQAAVAPPKPRLLASPTALTFLETSPDRPVRVSKRDASCWF